MHLLARSLLCYRCALRPGLRGRIYGDLSGGGSARGRYDPSRRAPTASPRRRAIYVPAYARTFGVNASITRGSNTYGPNQYPEKLIPLFTTNALDGEPLPLYGDGAQVRDWLHVEATAPGSSSCSAPARPGEIYNVGGGEEVENRAIAERIVDLTGADPALLRSVADRPGHDRRYSLDTGKLHTLGWKAGHALADGLPATVEWYRASRAWWEPIKTGEYRAYYERQYAERLA